MEEGKCWYCKKFEEHFYKDHLQKTSFHFMKVMEGDFSHRMELPKKFVRNFKVDLPDLITLKSSNEDLWKISFSKEENHSYLKDGWKEFINAHGVKEGYSLCFKYAGNSTFTVKIFDKSGCFRDNSSFARYYRKAYKVCQIGCYRVGKSAQNLKRSRSSMVEIDSSDSSSRLPCYDYKQPHEILIDETVSYKRKLKERSKGSERKQVMENSKGIFKKLKPSNVSKKVDFSYVRVMKMSHLREHHPFMAIPCGFVSEHFQTKPESIILRNKKQKEWTMNCDASKTCFGFGGKSLFRFVQDNKLKEGDKCVFTLISSSSKVVMDVRIV